MKDFKQHAQGGAFLAISEMSSNFLFNNFGMSPPGVI